MIAVVDYGMGNLRSVSKAFEHLGYPVSVTRDAEKIQTASHVVLPGVGAFPDCMKNIERFDLVDPLLQAVKSGKPFLGICLGLQLLFTESEEFGKHRGLDLLPGRVVEFPRLASIKIPHMGWNQLKIKMGTELFNGIKEGDSFYFVHSFYVEPSDSDWICTQTDYGISFTSSILKENIFACQFHPEKSQANGLKLIDNFAKWNP